MKLEDVQRDSNKDIVITIRTTRENSEWMKRNSVSPSLLFDRAIEELKKNIAEDGLKGLAKPR